MATLKQRLNRKNSSGTYDTVHLETSSEVVKRPSGTTVESDLTNYLPKVQNSDSVPESLKSGQLVTGQTSLIYKGNDGTARSINPSNYAAANHNHNGVYQPAGSYAAANHNHSGVYQPVGSYATTTQLNDLKTSVSNGKSAVASAITDKGVSTSATASFDTMANNIRSIGMIVSATLPAGYTACNYIQTDGNAWINTGIDLTSSAQYLNEIYVTSSFPSNTHINQKPFLSAINSDSGTAIYISQTTYKYTNSTKQYSIFFVGANSSKETAYHMLDKKITYYIGISRSTINEC